MLNPPRQVRKHTLRLAVTVPALAALALGSPAAFAAAQAPAGPARHAAASHAGSARDARRACRAPHPGQAACLVLVRTNVAQRSQAQIGPDQAPSGEGYGPASLQSAYNLPSATAGWSQTVALVDAYDYPTAATDLATYRADWGLPPCNTTTGAGCLTKVNENGAASPLPSPAGSTGWATEEALDIEMVSAACPNCHILLVEANSASIADLGTAVNSAVSLGAKYVSNSYGAPESSGETSYDTYYNHPGVAVTVAAGDSGYGTAYPAASQYVTAVGGTSLTQVTSPRGWTETAWSGTGSGCSGYESKPTWQTDTGCAKRTETDVSAVADPDTGVAVYDTYDQSGWLEVGGTSVASPLIASVYALAGPPAAGTYPSSYPYAHTASLNDVTSGSNGTCSPAYLCTAGPGYDGPTGLGTPNGTDAFSSATVAREMGPSSVGLNTNGLLQIFARGADGAVWTNVQDSSAPSGWAGWSSLGGGPTFAEPAVGTNNNGRLELFDVAANGQLYHDFQSTPGGSWSGWSSLGGTLASYAVPAVGLNTSGALQVFALGTNGAIWTATQNSSYPSGWTSLSSLGGSLSSAPAVGRNASGTLEIFAAGSGAVMTDTQTAPGGSWSGWSSLGGTVSPAVAPTVGANTSGTLQVFTLGTNGAIWTDAQTTPGGSWSGFSSLGGSLTSAATVGQNSDGRLEIFAQGSGGAVMHDYQNTPGGSWSGWSSLGGTFANGPAVGQNSGGLLEIFARGSVAATWHNYQTTGGWSGWSSLG